MTIYPLPGPNRAVCQDVPIYSSHFDLFRGLAALAVMIGHLKFFLGGIRGPATGGVGFVPPLAENPNQMNPAHEAVIVFFVLSGVLVGGSVLRDRKTKLFSWSLYLLRRLSRLLTVLLPALLVGFLVDSATRHLLLHYATRTTTALGDLSYIALDWKTFLGNLCFLQTLDRTRIRPFGTNVALWSLSFEFWYYLFFPLLVGALFLPSRRRKITYCLLSILLAYFLWRDPLSRFPIWLLGALATQLPPFLPERWQRFAIALLAVQFIACAGVLWIRPLQNFLLDDMILGLSFTALVVAVLHRRSFRPKGFYASFAEHLAKPSYSVYLFHVPIMTFLGSWAILHSPTLLNHKSEAILLIGSVVYALCYLLYFAFEARTDRVREAAGQLFGIRRIQRVPVLRGEAAS
jgi:peptidoglycan/LPS O-acetylase OafA/YrhL